MDIKKLIAENDRLRAQLAESQRREQAATEDFKAYMERNIHKTFGVYACDMCKRGSKGGDDLCAEKGCDGVSKWEWRGPGAGEGDNNGAE